MKLEKLDQKQLPQVIILGVLSVGVLGYAGYGIMFGGPQRAPQAAQSASSSSRSSASLSPGASDTVDGSNVQVAQNITPEIPLPSQFNPDPFQSPSKPTEKKAPRVEVSPKPAPAPAPAPSFVGRPPVMPDASRPLLSGGVVTPVPVTPPPPPEKPDVRVTGTSVVDGMSLAILEVGQDHRVVQVGDLVAKGYRVKKIQLEGVLFASKRDSFFRPVGGKEEPRKDEPEETGRPES